MGESTDWGLEAGPTAALLAARAWDCRAWRAVRMPAAAVNARANQASPVQCGTGRVELDERWRPGTTWTAKARGQPLAPGAAIAAEHTSGVIVAAVHLIDAEPVAARWVGCRCASTSRKDIALSWSCCQCQTRAHTGLGDVEGEVAGGVGHQALGRELRND